MSSQSKSIQTICPICKEEVDKSGFSDHVLECANTRTSCQYCSATFKKKEYLARHLKLKHNVLTGPNLKTTPRKPAVAEPEKDAGLSDWEQEPEVHLTDEESSSSSSSSEDDKVTAAKEVSDGAKDKGENDPVIRKRTVPAPVSAPVKRKIEEAKVMVQKDEVAGTSTASGHQLDVSVKFQEGSGRALAIKVDKEDVMWVGWRIPTIELSFGDFIGPDTIITAKDVKVHFNKDKFEFNLKYN